MESSSSAHKVCSDVELLSKILAGLPLSSLRLSKLVCKRWLSLITDQYFNSLRMRNPNAHHSCGLFIQLEQPLFVFPPYLPLKTSPYPYPSPLIISTSLPFYPSTNIKIMQSCNGLLLCYDYPDKFYVYNPTLNHCKLLPTPRFWKPNCLLRYMALAFDPKVSPHYKTVYPSLWPGGDVRVEIYSSENGNWKTCHQTDFSLPTFVTFDWRVVYWRDAIHWVSAQHIYHLSLLDAEEENILQVEDSGRAYGECDKLFVSGDCLLLVRKILDEPIKMNVYEMKNKNDGLSIKYRINLQSSPDYFLGSDFNVLAIVLREREDDSFLVLEENSSILIQYNFSSNTFHQLRDLTHTPLREKQYDLFFFTPSLVGV